MKKEAAEKKKAKMMADAEAAELKKLEGGDKKKEKKPYVAHVP